MGWERFSTGDVYITSVKDVKTKDGKEAMVLAASHGNAVCYRRGKGYYQKDLFEEEGLYGIDMTEEQVILVDSGTGITTEAESLFGKSERDDIIKELKLIGE